MTDLDVLANKLANADPKHSVLLTNGFVLSLIRERDAMREKLAESVRLLSRIARVYGNIQDGNGNTPTEIRKVEAFLVRQDLNQEQPA